MIRSWRFNKEFVKKFFLLVSQLVVFKKQKFLKFFCIPPTLISSPEFFCHMIIHDSFLTKFFAPPLSTLFYIFGVYDGGTVCVTVPWPPESGTVASYRYRERDNIITRQRQCWGAALANKKADCFVVGTARRNHKLSLVSIFRGRRFFSSAHWFSMRASGIFFFWKH